MTAHRLAWTLLLSGCVAEFPAYQGTDGGIDLPDARIRDLAVGRDLNVRDHSVLDADVDDGRPRDAARQPLDSSTDAAPPPVDLAVPVDARAVDASRPPDAGSDGLRYRWVDAGKEHTCAIRGDYTITCWGHDPDDGRSRPPPGFFSRLSVGEAHGCAWGSVTFPVCWGRNNMGSTEPPFTLFRQIEAGQRTTCGLDALFGLHCWGEDYHGLVSQAPGGGWYDLTLSSAHACAAGLDQGVLCWGNDGQHQLTRDPLGVIAGAGAQHTCVMDETPRVYCLGTPDTGPPGLAMGTVFILLTAGDGHTCGLTIDNTIQCWGANRDGQATPPPGRFRHVSAGGEHTCALREDGEVLCWGKNNRGQATVPP